MSGIMHALKQEILKRHNAISPNFRSGDTVIVYVPMLSKGKVVQKPFEGVCIRKTASGFSVKKNTGDDSVEISYSLFTPSRVDVISYGKVRRARIYYMRDLRGKKARIKRDYGRGVIKNANN